MNQTMLCAQTLERLQSVMTRRGLDALILSLNHHTRYVTGYQRYFSATTLPFVHAAIVPRSGAARLLLPEHILNYGRRACPTARVSLFAPDWPTRLAQLHAALVEAAVAAGQIGLDLDFQRADLLADLQSALPGAAFAPAAECLAESLRLKLPGEVTRLRQAARLVDLGTAAMFAAARPGVTEQAVAAAGAAALAEAEAFHHCCVRTGENAIDLCPINTDRVIRTGDVVQLDLGYVVDGYVSDINRSLIVGGPTPEQAHIIRTVVAMERAVIAALRPGVAGRDLFALARDLASSAGLVDYFRMPYVGHGIGLSLQERPMFKRDCAEVEHAAQMARLELLRLYGQQEQAFTYTLPLCRGLR